MSKSDEHRSKSDTSKTNEHWSNSTRINERKNEHKSKNESEHDDKRSTI